MRILPNGIAVIDGDTHIGHWVESENRLDHDQNLLPVLRPYIHSGDWIVDAGAFIGDHTKAYLDWVGDSGVVVAFEPNPEAYECLTYNCPKAITANLGLAAAYSNHKLMRDVNAGASHLTGEGTVVCLPLDVFGLPRLDFLKADIEGFEVEMIHGAKKTIAAHKPVICLEINESALARRGFTPLELISLVESLGYKYQLVYDSDKLTMKQFDLLFIPQAL